MKLPLMIHPYKRGGVWVFDDPTVGLMAEPFVMGIPEITESWTKGRIQDAENGFSLSFSPGRFAGYQAELIWVREEGGGNWYRLKGTDMKGWLCPALYRYFRHAPRHLYLRADPRAGLVAAGDS